MLVAWTVLLLALALQSPPVGRGATNTWAAYCANCHGPKLDGGQAPTLLDDAWTFGGDDASMAQSIRDGRPPTPMPSFKAALSEQEIRALVIFIHEEHARRRAARAPPRSRRRPSAAWW